MSIPLVQNNDKDAINTSIIAIKRNIERINMLLGLSNSEEIDTSKFATKDELQQAVTDLQPVDEVAVDNMHSVSSNAVAEKITTINNSLANKLTTLNVDDTLSILRNRASEKTVSLNAMDVNNTGLSIDFDYNTGTIRMYYIVNGVTQGVKTIQ